MRKCMTALLFLFIQTLATLLGATAFGAERQDILLELPTVDSEKASGFAGEELLKMVETSGENEEKYFAHLKTVLMDNKKRVFVIETPARKVRVFSKNKLVSAFSIGLKDFQDVSYSLDENGTLLAVGHDEMRAHVFDFEGKRILDFEVQKSDLRDLRIESGNIVKKSSGKVLKGVSGAGAINRDRIWVSDLVSKFDPRKRILELKLNAVGVEGTLPTRIGDYRFAKLLNLDSQGRLFCAYYKILDGNDSYGYSCMVFDIFNQFKKVDEIGFLPIFIEPASGEFLKAHSVGGKFFVELWRLK